MHSTLLVCMANLLEASLVRGVTGVKSMDFLGRNPALRGVLPPQIPYRRKYKATMEVVEGSISELKIILPQLTWMTANLTSGYYPLTVL